MKSTERKASAGMITLVLTILGLAGIMAASYFVLLTPGEPEQGQPSPHSINQNGG